jgi:hypothetical protein
MHMKTLRPFKQLFSFATMLALAFSILALPGTAWSGLRDDMREFHAFLRYHPRISADLNANPNLVNSWRYLNQHEDLARFLRSRPALREEVRVNPVRVMRSSYAYGPYDPYDRYGRWR